MTDLQELTTVTSPMIAIVHFKSDELMAQRGGRVIYYQVTIDPENLKGQFIRFGNCHGDEITGWVPEDNLVIDEVLVDNATPSYMNGMKSQGAMLAA